MPSFLLSDDAIQQHTKCSLVQLPITRTDISAVALLFISHMLSHVLCRKLQDKSLIHSRITAPSGSVGSALACGAGGCRFDYLQRCCGGKHCSNQISCEIDVDPLNHVVGIITRKAKMGKSAGGVTLVSTEPNRPVRTFFHHLLRATTILSCGS